MNIRTFFFAILFLSICHVVAGQNNGNGSPAKKVKVLVHITHGPENPTRAALGFLVAKTAIDEGHDVNLFLAGDAVKLLQDSILNTLTGIGTGKLRDHYDAIIKGGGKFYLSGNSSKARGVTEADLKNKPAEFAMPNVLVRLSVESDRMFTY
ncbi:MAG: DsrE family protein [Chitinophagaceae bacterium]